MTSCSPEETWSLLTSRGKLDRDRGGQQLQKILEGGQGLPDFLSIVIRDRAAELAAAVTTAKSTVANGSSEEGAEDGWEARLGFLLLCKTALEHGAGSSLAQSCEHLPSACLALLWDREARVRSAAGQVLGLLCKAGGGPAVYEGVRDRIFASVKEDLEREQPPANRQESDAFYHDTAGWRNLETSLQCIQHMVSGCGPSFAPHVDSALLDLLAAAVEHQNRFVRETGFATLSALVSSGCVLGGGGGGGEQTAASRGASSLDARLASVVGAGMADNWSQVRLAASVTCRHFFQAVGAGDSEGEDQSSSKERYFPALLPPLCLNRYYMAEGVRIYCQQTWKAVVGDGGIKYVEKYLDDVVAYYAACAGADNHAVREAACHCVAELATKLDKGPESRLRAKSEELLSVLLRCFADDSWPVRDAACVASGRLIAAFPEQCEPKMSEILPLMIENLKDPIASVRQGAALSLASAAKTFPSHQDQMISLIKTGLSGIKDQPEESLRYGDLSTGPAEFGVAKRARDNDAELHENKQMYSCGSLAPKMGRGGGGGGCTDAKFRKPSEPWECADGCVHLLAELLTALCPPPKSGGRLSGPPKEEGPSSTLHPLLAEVACACQMRHYASHPSFLETTMRRLPDAAKCLDKRTFKLYLEEFVEPAFYCCDLGDEAAAGGGASGSGRLAAAAAEQCLRFLSSHLGPNILRGRIEQVHPRYLSTLDDIMEGGGMGMGMGREGGPFHVGGGSVPMDCSPSPSSISSPMAMPAARGGGQAPSLGGTPT